MSDSSRGNNHLNFAKNEDDARERHEKYKSKDPFPEIFPALLNSADVADYVSKTGMIFPFDPEKLKAASYEMVIGGEVIHCDDDGKTIHIPELSDEREITFYRNSITFVTVNAAFRLPDYIALRFNLQIEHVHRGLLLGTGPLINPGFRGKLMIPIHNLTNNDYEIKFGEPLIGVEFTKISPNTAFNGGMRHSHRNGNFIPNKGMKDDKNFPDFIKKALPVGVGSVKSSISATLADTRSTLDKVEERLLANKKFVSKVQHISFFSAIGIGIALVALVLSAFSVINDVNKYVADATMVFKNNKSEMYQLRDIKRFEDIINNEPFRKSRIDSLSLESQSLTRRNIFLTDKIVVLESKISMLESQLHEMCE